MSPQDAGGAVGDEVVAACALSAVPGLGATALGRIAAHFGSFADALRAGPRRIVAQAAALQLRREAVEYLSLRPDVAELGLQALALARSAGARVLLRSDLGYPPLLASIEHPPPLLYVRGALRPEARRVALVGARDSDDYGLDLARALGEGLAASGVEIISGGARGIDAAAHAGALWGQGTTVAVLGSGIDLVYPAEHTSLFERLAAGGGAVVSEFPPGTASLRQNFPRRNRTISGLSDAVVVIRARRESGSLITADHAAAQGRPIFAVPGRTDELLSEGPNQLLKLGAAQAITSARDLLEAMGWPLPESPERAEGDSPLPRGLHPTRAPPPPSDSTQERPLDADQILLFNLLDERAPMHLDDLSIRAGVPVNVALVKLSDLELRGFVVHRPGKYFLRRLT
jgi:DNA processing protein